MKRFLLVVLGSCFSAIALKIFVQANGLLSGGFSGVSILLTRILADNGVNISFGIIYLLLNIPVTVMVFRYVGRKFTLFSLLNILLVSTLTDLIPIPEFILTDDVLLLAIFGGIISGIGSLLALSANASGGGTDFLAIFFANRYNKPMWNYVLIFNGCVLLVSGLLYNMENAMYSIIYQFSSTQLINAFHTRYKLITLHIITSQPEEVAKAILSHTRHGITRLDGVGVYTGDNRSLLYMVLNAFEVDKVVKVIQSVDSQVFINQSQSSGIVGNYHQQPYD